MFFTTFSVKSEPLRVILDPGHGGIDRGAIHHGVTEAQVNLKVALALNEILVSDKRFSPQLTRTKDITLSLEDRSAFANFKNGDIFLSLHANAYLTNKAKGVEIYFQNQLPPDEEVMFLANKENENRTRHDSLHWPLGSVVNATELKSEVASIIQDLQLNSRIRYSSLLAESINKYWRGHKRHIKHLIKQAPFHVISNVTMPANLIEMGYLSNEDEAKELNSKKYQNKIAESIYMGLVNFKDSIDKSPPNNLN